MAKDKKRPSVQRKETVHRRKPPKASWQQKASPRAQDETTARKRASVWKGANAQKDVREERAALDTDDDTTANDELVVSNASDKNDSTDRSGTSDTSAGSVTGDALDSSDTSDASAETDTLTTSAEEASRTEPASDEPETADSSNSSDEPDSSSSSKKTTAPKLRVTSSVSKRTVSRKQADDEQSEQPKKRKKSRVVLIIVAIIMIIFVVGVGLFSWDHWARYDDASDLQGTWYVMGQDTPVSFSEDTMTLNERTAYSYTIDSQAKTIHYSIGALEGGGRYWFSADRNVLVIIEGSEFTFWDTTFNDALLWFLNLVGQERYPHGESLVVFRRVSRDMRGLEHIEANNAEKADQEAKQADSDASEQDQTNNQEDQSVDTQEGNSEGDDSQQGDPQDKSRDGKSDKSSSSDTDEMSEAPISDLLEKDDTPIWGQSYG